MVCNKILPRDISYCSGERHDIHVVNFYRHTQVWKNVCFNEGFSRKCTTFTGHSYTRIISKLTFFVENACALDMALISKRT